MNFENTYSPLSGILFPLSGAIDPPIFLKTEKDISKNSCKVCRKQTKFRCSGCHKVYYCCEEHSKLDWAQHKKECKDRL